MARIQFEKSGADLSRLMAEEEPETKPKKPKRQRLVSRQEVKAQQNSLKPEEVSQRVWDLAEHWLATGEATFGKRPPVNKPAFSRRLSDKINHDRTLRDWLKKKPEVWEKTKGAWADAGEFVNDVVAKAIDLFFKYLTEDEKNTSALQFLFLEDEWDHWIDRGLTEVRVGWLNKHAVAQPMQWPSEIIDRRTCRPKPRPEDPCPDPSYAGMTWGEVWAQDEEDRKTFFAEPSGEIGKSPEEIAREERSRERVSWMRSVMLRNRSRNHHEETSSNDA